MILIINKDYFLKQRQWADLCNDEGGIFFEVRT
jgi:hypothetical protein